MQQYHFTSGIGRETERPVLLLGLVGFNAEQEPHLRKVIGEGTGSIAWQVGAFAEADAWWVNGSRTQMLADGSLRVASGVAGGWPTQFSLTEVDRPIAFSEPLSAHDFEPACRFTMGSSAGMQQMLARFERWLRPLASQLCLASQLAANESRLLSSVYHVGSNGRLLAVVDLRGEAGVLPAAGPADFASAEWSARPWSANYIPESFVRMSMSVLMWQYASRTGHDLLPARYRSGPIYFRRAPRLPHRLVKDSHLLIMRELACGAAPFEQLLQRTGLGVGRLARDLAALYLVGAITSKAKRARPGSMLPRMSESSDPFDSPNSRRHSGLPSRPAIERLFGDRFGGHGDPTAPAPMLAAR